MADVPQVRWVGLSGREYDYWVYPLGTSFQEKPGNYIFASCAGLSHWAPCYIGETENLNQRLGDHEKEACAKRHGATHIHVHLTNGGEAVRKVEEKDLIQNYQPPCNEQFT